MDGRPPTTDHGWRTANREPLGQMMAGIYVALIRGINVGRAKRVAMADLRELVRGLGYVDVKTVLNSGNVVFTTTGRAADPGALIEKAMGDGLGVSARVITLKASELDSIVSRNPLPDVEWEPSRLLVGVLAKTADRAKLDALKAAEWAPEALAVGQRVAYMWCPSGVIASRLVEAVGRALGDSVTTRNWATLMKLRALVES